MIVLSLLASIELMNITLYSVLLTITRGLLAKTIASEKTEINNI